FSYICFFMIYSLTALMIVCTPARRQYQIRRQKQKPGALSSHRASWCAHADGWPYAIASPPETKSIPDAEDVRDAMTRTSSGARGLFMRWSEYRSISGPNVLLH